MHRNLITRPCAAIVWLNVQLCSRQRARSLWSSMSPRLKMVRGRGHARTLAGVSLEPYVQARRRLRCPVVAIPSQGRAQELCLQTLSMLQRHDWDMAKVHVFVPPSFHDQETTKPEDEQYRTALNQHGFSTVRLHTGANGLSEQYNCIFRHFAGQEQVLVLSDTVQIGRAHV